MGFVFVLLAITAPPEAKFELGKPVRKEQLAEYLRSDGTVSAEAERSRQVQRLRAIAAGAKRATINKNLTKQTSETVIVTTTGMSAVVEARTSKDKQRLIDETQQAIDRLAKSALTPHPPRLPAHKMRVGDVGVLYCPRDSVGLWGDEATQMRVLRIVDPMTAIVEIGENDKNKAEFMLVRNTNELADGVVIPVGNQCYEVIGTDKFRGSTLFKVRPIDIADFLNPR